MAAIMIGEHARPAWLAGLAAMRAKAYRQARRAMACAAAAILICATGAVLAELAAQLLSICVPAGIAVVAAAVAVAVRSLRRAWAARTVTGTGPGPATRGRKPRRVSC